MMGDVNSLFGWEGGGEGGGWVQQFINVECMDECRDGWHNNLMIPTCSMNMLLGGKSNRCIHVKDF